MGTFSSFLTCKPFITFYSLIAVATMSSVILNRNGKGTVLRWRRNRMGRPRSLPQTHWKNIWTLSKFHKQLLNAGRGHQAPRKAAHCLRKEVGKNIKDEKRDKRDRDGDLSREGSLEKERSFQTPGNTLTGKFVGRLGTSEGNITGRKNK